MRLGGPETDFDKEILTFLSIFLFYRITQNHPSWASLYPELKDYSYRH